MTKSKLNAIIRLVYVLSEDIPPELSRSPLYLGVLNSLLTSDELGDVCAIKYTELISMGGQKFDVLLKYIQPQYRDIVTDIHNEMLMASS